MTDDNRNVDGAERPDEHERSTVAEAHGDAPIDVVDDEAVNTADAGPVAEGDAADDEADEIEKHIDVVLIKRVLEAAIMSADGPLDRDAMLLLFDEAERPGRKALNAILEEMKSDCEGRGVELREVASGFRYQARRELGPWVSRLWQEKPPRYSRAILETLALIAYRQPITRGEIEEIRGVSVNTHIVKTLLERGWIRIVGHRDVPGRPAMFATTRLFLDYFDLKSLEDLPSLSEIRDLDKINEELELEQKARAEAEAESLADDAEAGDEDRQVTIDDALEQEPEIDESTLMSLEQVDAVLHGFEAEFRKKPADKAAEEEQSQTDIGPGTAQDGSRDDPQQEQAASKDVDEEEVNSPHE